jgi:hypothetical protein
MGDIESGVRRDLRKLDITEPSTALEFMAILLAQLLDTGPDPKEAMGLSRELRLTLVAIAEQPTPTRDITEEIADRCREDLP